MGYNALDGSASPGKRMLEPFSPKQLEFIVNAHGKWNMAHGSVRCGKTVCATFLFMLWADECPDSQIYIVGHTFDTAYRNIVRLLMESEVLKIWRPFLTWSGKKLHFVDSQGRSKVITVLGAKDEGAIGNFQGDTHSLTMCDEITLYPESIIDMIDSRLSMSHSKAIATMNPTHPTHKVKQWIDKGLNGDANYYSLHFTLDDNPYVPDDYKQRLRDSSSGVFYKRNYLGLWCLAEGAIFDFFDKKIHVVTRAPVAAEYYIAGIDYGTSNAFACVLIGVSTGKYTQSGKQLWVEDEYYWNPAKTHRQKVNSELADDVQKFLEPYGVKQLYIDPSAEAFQLELSRRGMHPVHANNDVFNGIQKLATELRNGVVVIKQQCTNLIREIESYVWDKKASEKGEDKPVKKDDHAVDALRYAIASHKVNIYDPYKQTEMQREWNMNKYNVTRNN